MNITLGFSPCPNDTYMFAALVNKWIDTQGFDFTVLMEDVEQLNQWAAASRLDVTKMSFHRSLSLEETYTLLNSGAALGIGCGPLLISKHTLGTSEVLEGPVALPGEWTTAHLLFNIFYPGCQQKQFHLFSEIEDLVLNETVSAGVIIHENRFTYKAKGLVKIMDLGESWESKTGLPIPLGGIFAHTRVPEPSRLIIEDLVRQSILFAHSNHDMVMTYVRQFAQEMDEGVMISHINLYVNEFSLNLGENGLKSIEALKNIFR